MADDTEIIDWPEEEIPPEHKLFMRVHRSFVSKNGSYLGAFKDQGGGMSTEWQKYSTPKEARDRAKKPADNGVIQMIVGEVSAIPRLAVRHTPDFERRVRVHTDVLGPKDPEVRIKLARISRWVPGFELI